VNVLNLAQQKVNLKKVASTHGGEWTGPCPGCGGNDRFHVWPNTNGDKGSYWCRGCGKSGDNIQFLIDFEGLKFKEACARLDIEIKNEHSMSRPAPSKPEFQPVRHGLPAELWQNKAKTFVTWAHENLKQNPDVLKWLAARGISAEAAAAARLGWNPGENGNDLFRSRPSWGLPELKKENGKPRMLWFPIGLVIPYIVDDIILRIRIRRPEGEPRYYVIPGSSMATTIIGADRKAFVVVESELDGIACAAATELAGAVALGMLEGKPDASAYAILKDSVQILNALDYGDQGGGKKAAERAMIWWKENFNERYDRWPVPKGKDPGEAYQQGIDLGKWIEAGLPPSLTLDESSKFDVQRSTFNCPPLAEVAQSAGGGELSPLVDELHKLLKSNPAVKIINKPERLSIERNGKYVGGRINDLVFKEPDVQEYILNHPDEEITGKNLMTPVKSELCDA
jgi:DNA primase